MCHLFITVIANLSLSHQSYKKGLLIVIVAPQSKREESKGKSNKWGDLGDEKGERTGISKQAKQEYSTSHTFVRVTLYSKSEAIAIIPCIHSNIYPYKLLLIIELNQNLVHLLCPAHFCSWRNLFLSRENL